MSEWVAYWYQNHWLTYLLRPLGWLFAAGVKLRRFLYRQQILKSHSVGVPVIVIGNITVGGTGKTPLVAWMVHYLRAHGYRPGVVSRGYGGKSMPDAVSVYPHSDPREVGDEAVMLTRQAHCPMVVAKDRVAAARALCHRHDCDIIVSDDGMQHYALARDIEIAVVDGHRQLGNGCFLPAGPLREGASRLQTVHFVVSNGKRSHHGSYYMEIVPKSIYNLTRPSLELTLAQVGQKPLHAVTGIGNPGRFFATLRGMGFQFTAHAFPDHHFFTAQEIDFEDDAIVIMTEKDAVKCHSFADARHWCLATNVVIEEGFARDFGQKLQQLARSRTC